MPRAPYSTHWTWSLGPGQGRGSTPGKRLQKASLSHRWSGSQSGVSQLCSLWAWVPSEIVERAKCWQMERWPWALETLAPNPSPQDPEVRPLAGKNPAGLHRCPGTCPPPPSAKVSCRDAQSPHGCRAQGQTPGRPEGWARLVGSQVVAMMLRRAPKPSPSRCLSLAPRGDHTG